MTLSNETIAERIATAVAFYAPAISPDQLEALMPDQIMPVIARIVLARDHPDIAPETALPGTFARDVNRIIAGVRARFAAASREPGHA